MSEAAAPIPVPAFDVYPAIVRQGRQALYRKCRVVYDPERQRIRVWTAGAGTIQLAADFEVAEGGYSTSKVSWVVNVGEPLNTRWVIFSIGRPCNCSGARQLQRIDPWGEPA